MTRSLENFWDSIPLLPPRALLRSLYFEMRSAIGRMKINPLKVDPSQENYINLGSGPEVIPGFINIDFFTTPGIDYGADFRYPLKIPNDAIDGIFSEHTFEHLTYAQVFDLLGECHRILKQDGIIRIVVPDLSLFILNYCEKNQEWFDRWERLMFIESSDGKRAKRRLRSNLEAISFITQEYGHVSCWDLETLSTFLERSGFREIRKTGFRQGRCARLLIELDEEDRKFVSLYVEAVR